METVRDLAVDDPWRKSLERSLARRGGPTQSSREQENPRHARGAALARGAAPERGAARQHRPAQVATPSRRYDRETIAKRRRMVARAGKALAVVSLLATILAVELVSHTSPVSPSAAHADVRHVGHGYVAAAHVVRAAGRNDLGGAGVCPLAVRSTGYVNPLAKAKVKSERIDQGVDYAGSGTLIAIGAARVTHLATDGSGWPGAFIEYRLLNGPDAGCYVYYAEGVTPEPGLHVGATIGAGKPVATIIPQYQTGFEIGWGAGSDTKTYTAAHGKWTANDDQDNVASGPGQNFSALIAALGGPPGKVEG